MKLKAISKELKSKFIKQLCETVANKHNLKVAFGADAGINNFVIFANEAITADDILKIVNESVNAELRIFIETETGDNAKEYDRSIALFESTSTDVNLNITW